MRRPARFPSIPAALATALVLGAALPAPLVGCGGRGTHAGLPVEPRLTASRLGSIRGAMTYDGDWMGGVPATEDLADDLELAARRGVEIVVDLRNEPSKIALSLVDPVIDAGMDLVEVDPAGPDTPELAGRPPISDIAVDRVRKILELRGRERALLLDESGTSASMIYAIHLIVDKGFEEDEALRAARAIGIDEACAAFVHQQVERIRSDQGGG